LFSPSSPLPPWFFFFPSLLFFPFCLSLFSTCLLVFLAHFVGVALGGFTQTTPHFFECVVDLLCALCCPCPLLGLFLRPSPRFTSPIRFQCQLWFPVSMQLAFLLATVIRLVCSCFFTFIFPIFFGFCCFFPFYLFLILYFLLFCCL
jgi:hypothetical protein